MSVCVCCLTLRSAGLGWAGLGWVVFVPGCVVWCMFECVFVRVCGLRKPLLG